MLFACHALTRWFGFSYNRRMNTLFSPKLRIVGASVLAVAFLFSASAALAASPKHTGLQNSPGPSGLPLARASAGKLKACQARENGIKNRSSHLTDLASTMESHFDAIVKRVQDYYTQTVVPSGKTLPNYDALLSDIQTKKTAIQTALTKAQTDLNAFSCTAANPKTALSGFNQNMQSVKQALKNYRTSIKNLIVAVHSLAGENNSNEHPNVSVSPEPEHSGEQQ